MKNLCAAFQKKKGTSRVGMALGLSITRQHSFQFSAPLASIQVVKLCVAQCNATWFHIETYDGHLSPFVLLVKSKFSQDTLGLCC